MTAARKTRAAGGGGVGDAPRLHEDVGHLGQVGVQILRLRDVRIEGRVCQGDAASHGREPGVEAAARCRNRRRNRAIPPMSSSRREAGASSSRARTVFEGVIFLALASAFIALRVSLSPFASRYASTAGTRSAAFALIAQLSVGDCVAPQRGVSRRRAETLAAFSFHNRGSRVFAHARWWLFFFVCIQM